MSFTNRNVESVTMDMQVARSGAAVLEVTTGAVGGLALHALFAEHRPLKAALLGASAAGLGLLAFKVGDSHEDSARFLGALQALGTEEPREN